MRKFLIGATSALIGLALFAAPAFAVSPPKWELKAPSGIDFVCGGGHYLHTLNTVNNNDPTAGLLTGTGFYNPDLSYKWNFTGSISGNNLNFKIVYTGTGAGTTYNAVGVIAPDGSINGTVDNNCQTFSMGAGSAKRVMPTDKDQCKKDGWKDFGFKNQGECVSYVEHLKDKDKNEHGDNHNDSHGGHGEHNDD